MTVSTIKLKATNGGGSVALKGVANTAHDVELEMPADIGTADQYLKLTSISGKTGTLTWTASVDLTSVGSNILPDGDNTRDLGSAAKRWANVHVGDIELSNEGSKNEVDGSWGKWTIQEGEKHLFLINRRSNKKYKFILQEVSEDHNET